MIEFSMEDVMNVVNTISGYLIAIGVVLVLAIVAMVGCMKQKDHVKFMVRAQAGGALVLALVIILNLICLGPMKTMISLAMGEGHLTEETITEVLADVQKVSEEGTVLLENENNFLPLTNTTKLNVFGWASVAPNYSGRGSGAASGQYEITTLYDGLKNAGFTLNDDLYNFYMNYASERPEIGTGIRIGRSLSPPPPHTPMR